MLEQVLCPASWQKHFQSLCPVASVPGIAVETWLRENKRNYILHCMAHHHLGLPFVQCHLDGTPHLSLIKPRISAYSKPTNFTGELEASMPYCRWLHFGWLR